MHKRAWFCLASWPAAICLLPLLCAAQTTRQVPQQYSTIQGAINASSNGDTVLVSPGTYSENINFNGKAITVQSVSGADVTIIDGGQLGTVVTFSTEEGPTSVLTGFTIQNGETEYSGSGIAISHASPTVTYNKVINNIGCQAVGIEVQASSGLIQGNVIHNNQQLTCSGGTVGGGIGVYGEAQIIGNVISYNVIDFDGGGIGLDEAGSPTIRNNIIMGNTAENAGGGISMDNLSNANIIQNLIFGNSAPEGGGVYWLVPSGDQGPLLVSNTIANNNSAEGSAIYADGFQSQVSLVNNLMIAMTGQVAIECGTLGDTPLSLVSYNDVFSSMGTAYGGICTDQTGMNGNISADPQFVNPANSDYDLQSSSPAVDAGNTSAPDLPPLDVHGDNRIINATIDMGVAEYISVEALALSNTSLAFGVQTVNTSSGPLSLTFTNNGTVTASVLAVMAAGDFTQTNTCGNSLAAGANCSVAVTFSPTMLGQRPGLVAIMTSASEAPQVVFLSGTGGPVPPTIMLIPH